VSLAEPSCVEAANTPSYGYLFFFFLSLNIGRFLTEERLGEWRKAPPIYKHLLSTYSALTSLTGRFESYHIYIVLIGVKM